MRDLYDLSVICTPSSQNLRGGIIGSDARRVHACNIQEDVDSVCVWSTYGVP